MSTRPCFPHESPTYSSPANHLKFDIKLAPSVSKASIRLSFKQQGNRIVIPRKDPILPIQFVGSRGGKHCRAAIQSANVSRQKIQIEEEGVQVKLQFSKEQTNRLKNLHKRTKSNHVELCEIKEDQLSNFSNSLQNISQEIIEIPFAKQIITPTPFPHKNQPENGKFRKGGSLEHSNGSSLQKRVLSPSLKLAFQRKSSQKCRNKQNEQVHSRTQSKTFNGTVVPRPKNKQAVSLALTDFNLKAIKITEGGSIIYLASQKRTNFLVAIKCIKKRALRQNIQAFILQLKLGLLLNNPNVAKIYGFFADSDNFYIIREYLQEGCILERRKKMGQNEIGCEINQVINGVIAVLPYIGCQWWLQPKNIAQTHSISKITSIKVNLRGSEQQFSERLKHCLNFMLQSERKSDLVKDMFETHQSIHLNMLRHGSYLLCSFREMLQSILILTSNQILMLRQAHFLKQFRFKALMEEG